MATNPTAGAVEAAKVSALLNGYYQADRESFLDRWHRFFMFLVIVLGAAAIVEALPHWARTAASVATATIGGADLVLNLSVRARTAAFLRKSYFELAAGLKDGSLIPVQAEAAMLKLSAEEEPPYMAAHALAENWATGAVYGPSKKLPCKISWWRKVTRHVFHHTSHRFSC